MSDQGTTQPLSDEERARLEELQNQDRLKRPEQEEHDALVARQEAEAAAAPQPAPDYHARLNADINPPPDAADLHPGAVGILGVLDQILGALSHLQQNAPGAMGIGGFLRAALQHLHNMKLEAGDPAAKAVEAAKAPPPEQTNEAPQA